MYDSVEPEPKKEFMSKLHEISFYCKHFLSNLILKIRFRILVYNILVNSIIYTYYTCKITEPGYF